MAKNKNKDKEQYGGLNLFDFMEHEIKINIENLKGEYNDINSSDTGGHGFSQENAKAKNIGVVGLESRSNIRQQDTTLFSYDSGEMGEGVSGDNVGSERYSTVYSINEADERGAGYIGNSTSVRNDTEWDNNNGNTSNERNTSIQVLLPVSDIIGVKEDFSANEDISIKSPKDKYHKNVKAIKLLKEIEGINRYATFEEQIILNDYSGWGGIPQAFDGKNKEWEKDGQKHSKHVISVDEFDFLDAKKENNEPSAKEPIPDSNDII
ncbi:MAG: hypothetical protein LBP54_02550 [Campylobacteraceae bacterium]|nr:hypothetical protein [Campylobacteraceae bacterium]